VLEVGLGYGTVSQRIAESGARYRGLDIAGGPISMVNDRLRQANLPDFAQQGSILAAPFPMKALTMLWQSDVFTTPMI
jgi:2-polyprenyl-3-methyl-5-hydroxy-6-metoxy-1,4-benzoquinol methylase